MFSNINNITGVVAIKLALPNKPSQKPSTASIIEASEIWLCNNNSKFDRDHLLQTNDTATGASNFCSHSDLVVYRSNKLINNERINNFSELFFYGRYRENCFVIWNGCEERLISFHQFLNSLDGSCERLFMFLRFENIYNRL